MARMKPCPVCGQNVGLDKLEAHVKKVHPHEKVEIKLDQKEQQEVIRAKKAYRTASGPKGKWAILVVAVVVIVIVVAFVLMPRAAKDFTLTETATGTSWNLNSHIGSKPILLEFFHPDCGVCIGEVSGTSGYSPDLKDLYSLYAGKVEFVSIAVRLDIEDFRNPPTVEMVNEFKATYDTQWTYLVDSGTVVRDMYEISGTPTFFLISKSGIIVYTQSGGGSLTALRTQIDTELAK